MKDLPIMFFSSLRVRLLAPVLVAVLPALGVLGYATVAQRRLLVADATAQAVHLANLVTELQQRPVDGARGLLLAISHMESVRLRSPSCSAQMAEVQGDDLAYFNIGAVDLDGNVFCSAAPRRGAVNLADRRFVQRALESRDFGVGEYVISRIRGLASIGFGQAVLAEDGSVQAVAFASLDVAHLQRQLDALDAPPGADVEVLDRRGVIIAARGHPERAGQPFDPEHRRELARAGAPLDFTGPDGIPRIHALRTVQDPSGEPVLEVVSGLPTAAVLGPVDDVTKRSLLAFAVLGALAAAAAGWSAEMLLVRKLKVLIATARRISAGDATARTGLEPGDEELGQLIRATDEMAASLQRQEAERRRLEDQLRHSQKMEAIGLLAGGVAHDFNNLLTAILSGARLIEEELPPGHQARQDAAEIRGAGERAAALTAQLLTFSRRQGSAPRPVSLDDLVRRLASLLRRLLGEAVTLEVVADTPVVVQADPTQLEQVIVNLAVNARDAMPKGGRLTLSVTSSGPGAAGDGGGAEPPGGPLAILSVKDTGAGMDAETQSRIFEPFFTTKGPGKGTGLGLSTVYGIVAQCRGTIRVRSTPGAGTEFVVSLPRHDGPVPAVDDEAQQVVVAGGSETILLVEDEERVRGTVRRILMKGGYAVLEAADPRSAVALAEDHPGKIDLLLSDVLLPEENGASLSRRLVAARPGLRVVFMSGYTGDVIGADLPGDVPLLAKPFTPDQLLAAVRRALAG